MVDVSEKAITKRTAVAESLVRMRKATRDAIVHQAMRKGDVLAIAELAGIMAAKKTSDLIPLCHPVPLHHVVVDMDFEERDHPDYAWLRIEAQVDTAHQTGVEMEALTACAVAALTVYDMCKKTDRAIEIEHTRLVYKSGGESGTFERR
ncbi:cyclic pyranopterin monophosphate synthase accessory protein [Alicyclobacillus hesperidum subsp. aegles]|nr:cyclic pyranopterin monophosphate synthase accessory protein [Alicyclobacillus hesperidum subsp. aegles]